MAQTVQIEYRKSLVLKQRQAIFDYNGTSSFNLFVIVTYLFVIYKLNSTGIVNSQSNIY